jgi:hypothetical protein
VSETLERRAIAIGFLGGVLLGAVAWSVQIQRSRRELFSRSPFRRLAALGYLSGMPSVEAARMLADYVGWERHPGLRRRGQVLLRRMHADLE